MSQLQGRSQWSEGEVWWPVASELMGGVPTWRCMSEACPWRSPCRWSRRLSSFLFGLTFTEGSKLWSGFPYLCQVWGSLPRRGP